MIYPKHGMQAKHHQYATVDLPELPKPITETGGVGGSEA